MSTKEMIEKLKAEQSHNKVASAVFHMFAMRQRSRHQITTRSLYYAMRGEGYKFSPSDYSQVLKFLATIGVGELEVDRKGRVKALKNVKVTLKSLGEAACGTEVSLDVQYKRNKFNNIVVPPSATKPVTTDIPTPSRPVLGVAVRLNFRDKQLTIPMSAEFTEEDIAVLLKTILKGSRKD